MKKLMMLCANWYLIN